MYLVLYRKYRPKTFADVISQPHITVTLKNEVAQGKTAHAYLFTGPRGTGKTTCAKILAKAVNCLSPIDGNPCLECDSCKAIEEGATLDIVEIDAASNNGVDDIRQLRDEAIYSPASCKYRVYIMDEVHMLSNNAFNAFLKIMEEPPPHVKFILATTEANKVLPTILSRCQRFDFKRIAAEDIADRLMYIASNEAFTLDREAAELIARLADGGMRDGCSLLDQCISLSDNVTVQTVSEAIGVADRAYLFDLTDCLHTLDASRAVMLINELYAMSKDMRGLIEEWVVQLRNILLTATLKEPQKLLAIAPDEMERCREYAEKIPAQVLLSSLASLRDCLDGMSRGTDQKLTAELCLIRICSPGLPPVKSEVNTSNTENTSNISNIANSLVEELATRVSAIERQLVKGVAQGQATTSSPPIPPSSSVKGRNSAVTANEGLPKNADMQYSTDTPAQANGKPVPYEPWGDILMVLSKEHPPLFGVLESARAFCDGVFLYLDTQSPTANILLKQEGNASRLLDLIAARTGMRYKIRMKASKAVEAPPSSPLEDILKKARETGVEVQEQ